MHVQSKVPLTQTISRLQNLLRANNNSETHKQIASCVEQLKNLQTITSSNLQSIINNVQEGNSGFLDKNINELQNVSAFIINSSTDVTNYYSKYIEPTIEGNKYKSTAQRKNFWAKLTDVITKVKKQADNATTTSTDKLPQLSQQQIRVLNQLSRDIIAGNLDKFNKSNYYDNYAHTYIQISDYYTKYSLSAEILQPFVAEFNKLSTLADTLYKANNFRKKDGGIVDRITNYIAEMLQEVKANRGLSQSVKYGLPDSLTKITKGSFNEQNYNSRDNKISYADTCNMLRVVTEDYQRVNQLLGRLAAIGGGEDPYYKNSSNVAMSVRCERLVEKMEKELKEAAKQMQTQIGGSVKIDTECSTGALLRMVKSYNNIVTVRRSNSNLEQTHETTNTPTGHNYNNNRIQYNSRVQRQCSNEEEREVLIVTKHFDEISKQIRSEIVSQIQPYGDKGWPWWRDLFQPIHYSKSNTYGTVVSVGQYKKQSTELPQIIIMEVLTQLAKVYDLPTHTSICELLDQIGKEQLMVEWINNHYKREPDSQHESTERTQGLQKKSSSGQLSFNNSGLNTGQFDPRIYKATIRIQNNGNINNPQATTINSNGSRGMNWSDSIKYLEDNNTKYLQQLAALSEENRKFKQTIEQYEKPGNANSNEQQKLLARIKQLQNSIATKDEQITNINNLMVQNIKEKEDEKIKIVSQLNQQIKTINQQMAQYKGLISNMQAGIGTCLNLIQQQQNVNFNNIGRSPIDNLVAAITALIERKRYYKGETLQIKDDLNPFYNRIDKLNLQAQIKTLADVVNTIEQYEEQRKQLRAFLTQVGRKAQLIASKKHPSDHVVVDYSKLSDHQRNATIMAVLDECLSKTNQLRIQDSTTIFATPQNQQYVLAQLTNYCRTHNNQINRFNLLFRGSQCGDITEALKKHPNILLLARMTFNDEVQNLACYSSQSQCETRGMPQIGGLLISTCLKQSYPLIHNKQPIKQQSREYVVFGNDAIKIDKVNLKKIFINVNADTGFDTKGESAFNLFGANENQIVADDFEIYEVVFKQNKIVEKAPQPQMIKSESKSNSSQRTGMMDTRKNSEIPKEEPLPMRNMSSKKMELEYNSMKQLQGQLKKRVQFLQKENEELHRRLDKYEPSNTPSGERQTLKPAASSNQLSRSSSSKQPAKLPQLESDVTGAQKRDEQIKQLQKKARIAEDQSKSKDSLLQQITLQKTNAEKQVQLLSKQLSQMKQIIEKLQSQNDKVRQQKQSISKELNYQANKRENTCSQDIKLAEIQVSQEKSQMKTLAIQKIKEKKQVSMTTIRTVDIKIQKQHQKQQLTLNQNHNPVQSHKKDINTQDIKQQVQQHHKDPKPTISKIIKQVIDQMLTEIERMNKQRQIQSMEQYLVKAKERSSKLKIRQAECTRSIQQKQKTIEQLSSQITQKTLKIDELRMQLMSVDDKRKEVVNLREQLEMLKKEKISKDALDKAASAKKIQTEEKQKLKEKQKQDQKQMNGARAALKEMNEKLATKQKQYNSKLKSTAQLSKRVEATDLKLKDMEKKLEDMKREKEQVDLMIKDMDRNKQIKEELQKQIGILRSNKEQQDSLYEIKKNAVAQLERQIKKQSALKPELNLLTNKVDTLKSQESTISQKIKQQESKMAALTQQIEELSKKKDSVTKQMETQKQQHKYFMQQATSQQNKINSEIVKVSKELTETKNTQLKISGVVSKFFVGEVVDDETDCKFIIDQINKLYPYRSIRKTKLLFAFPLMKDVNPHISVDGVPCYILILKMQNKNEKGKNYLIAMHSEKELMKGGELNNGKGFISSVTNQKTFYPRNTATHSPRVTTYDEFYLKFGNDEMLIKINSTVLNTCIGHSYKSFETKNMKNPEVFTGSPDANAEIEAYQVYQIVWNE